MTTGTDTMASLQSCTTAQGTQHTVPCVQVHVMAHSKRAHSYFIPIHIRVPYIQYTCVFHHACAGRKCGKRIYFFFLPPFFSFFSFLGLSSCLPWGLYLADQAEKDSNSSCILQHTPTPSDHRPTPSAVSSPCNGAHKEARPHCHKYNTRVPRPYKHMCVRALRA